MRLEFSDADLVFRDEVRDFFRTEVPADILDKRNREIELSRDDQIRYQKCLYARGWAGVNWPVEYGGTGWSPIQKYLFAAEAAAANAPDIIPFGINMVGPVIYSFGSDAQKRRFLPDILASDVWWCQGYSEPGAGSDLASLTTRAERVGDHYVVNGVKTWTTLAQYADWIFCLVRTSTEVARRQEGISFLLIDLGSPGITVTPIITLDGVHEVNEVRLDDVEVPMDNLVGEEGKGWTYGKVLLQHERTTLTGTARSGYRLRRLRRQAERSVRGAPPLAGDRNFMRALAAVEIELKALEITELRTLAAVAAGEAPGPASSVLKIRGTEIKQSIDTLYMDAAGYYALPYVPEQYALGLSDELRVGDGIETHSALQYFRGRRETIYGGSNEVQRNIIAKRVLGL